MATSLTASHVLKQQCERCAELEQRLEQTQVAAEMDMASLGAQLAQMRRENDMLRGKLADRAKDMSKRDQQLYLLWLEVHGKDPSKKVNAFGPAAQRALTRARRAGLEQDDMEKVIRTHARFPFLVFGRFESSSRNAKDRKDSLADCFADERRWNQLLELADRPPSFPHVPQNNPFDLFVAALDRANLKPFVSDYNRQGSAYCPIHDDREKSFRFKEHADNGSVLMWCHACAPGFVNRVAFCEAIRVELGLELTDLYPNINPNKKGLA